MTQQTQDTAQVTIDRLKAENKELVEALRDCLGDLESGFIAQTSYRADVRRSKLEAKFRAILSRAEGRG